MRYLPILTLLLGVGGASVAGENAPPTTPAPPAATEGAEASPPATSPEALQQAFDGAMTCSALTAVKSSQAGPDEAWRWGNRSFAFGMLAVHFYTDATKTQLAQEEVNNILTEYANTLVAMSPEERQPFEEGCARKYPDMDRLCELNACPRSPPGADAAPSTAPAEPSAPPQP
jgi:hypothetical protein